MTPRRLDPDSVQRKLVRLQELLDQLDRLTGRDLHHDDIGRGATLWVMTQLVTIAAGACAHLASALLGRSPATMRESFELAVEAGVLDEALLDDLRGAAGMRNVLVHEYGEIDLDRVNAAVPSAHRTFTTVVEQIARFLDDRAG